jgi:hypothetical protein
VRGAGDLRNHLALIRQGSTVGFVALRGGTPFVARVQLVEVPVQVLPGKGLNPLLDGVTFATIASIVDGENDEIEVYSVDRTSQGWRSGMRKGDLVTSVNQQRVVNGADGFSALVRPNPARLMIGLRRQGRTALALLQRE